MNCKQAEPLIPLFVETDLGTTEMQQVTMHVEMCDTCRTLAAEFQASQSSLHAMSLPAFDDAMMTAMRSAVCEKIAPTVSRPSIVDSLSPLWNWKIAFAAAAVILLVSGIMLLRRDAEDKNIPIAKKTNDAIVPAPRVEALQKSPRTQNVFQPRTGREHKAQGGVSVSERNPRISATNPLSPARATDIENQIAAAAIAPSGANNDVVRFSLPTIPQTENATASLEKNSSEPEMLRMEIQTADPNIKIIWLAPKEPPRTNSIADTK